MKHLACIALLLLVACDKPNQNCERAVNHALSLSKGPPGMPRPSEKEQELIDQIAKMSLDTCVMEGLSDAQRDCILATRSLLDRDFLMCPALVAKKPTWLNAPFGHPERLRGVDGQVEPAAPSAAP
jgi:hypothetical protein